MVYSFTTPEPNDNDRGKRKASLRAFEGKTRKPKRAKKKSTKSKRFLGLKPKKQGKALTRKRPIGLF